MGRKVVVRRGGMAAWGRRVRDRRAQARGAGMFTSARTAR